MNPSQPPIASEDDPPDLGMICVVLLCVPVVLGFFYFIGMSFISDHSIVSEAVWPSREVCMMGLPEYRYPPAANWSE